MGRQAHRLRRPRPALRHEVLHRQLPPRRGWAQRANKRIVIGRFGRITPDAARRKAQDLLGRVARGEDPAGERAETRRVPTLAQAFESHMAANPNRAANTVRLYRQNLRVNLSDWLKRPLDSITRQDVEDRFNLITGKHGWSAANQTMSMLRSIYRRHCVDHGGSAQSSRAVAGRRRALQPNAASANLGAGRGAAALARGYRSARAGTGGPRHLPDWLLHRHAPGARSFRCAGNGSTWTGVSCGSRRPRPGSRWSFQSPGNWQSSSSGVLADIGGPAAQPEGWVFPSSKSGTGYVAGVGHFHNGISEAGGTKFWFHGLRNAFITVAERELMLPRSLTKRLVNHARPPDVTEGYAADWTVEQLREPAQRVADRIDQLMRCPEARPDRAAA